MGFETLLFWAWIWGFKPWIWAWNSSEFKGKNKVLNSRGAVAFERNSKLKFRSLIAFSLHLTTLFLRLALLLSKNALRALWIFRYAQYDENLGFYFEFLDYHDLISSRLAMTNSHKMREFTHPHPTGCEPSVAKTPSTRERAFYTQSAFNSSKSLNLRLKI